MANTVFPADNAPQYTGRHLRQSLGVLSGGGTPSRPLGGFSAIRQGSGTVVTATSTTWTVTPHAGQLDLEAGAQAGTYLYAVEDSTNTGSVTAADASNPRVDIVYVTLNDPAEGDGSGSPAVVVGYLAGTPAATPAAPSTPVRSMVLATISVPKVGGGSPTVTMQAPEVTAGGILCVRSQAQRDALTALDGLQVFRLDTHEPNTYMSGAWSSGAYVAYAPNWSQVGGSSLSIGNGSLTGWYRADGKRVTYHVNFIRGSTTNVGTGAYQFDLPLPAADIYYSGVGVVVQSGNEFPIVTRGIGTTAWVLIQCSNNNRVSSSSPASPNWSSGDIMQATITYRAA